MPRKSRAWSAYARSTGESAQDTADPPAETRADIKVAIAGLSSENAAVKNRGVLYSHSAGAATTAVANTMEPSGAEP